MDNKTKFLTNNKNIEKIKNKESFIYKKGIKKNSKLSFDLKKDKNNKKNLKDNNVDNKKKLNNQNKYFYHLKDQSFDENKMIYNNILPKTQSFFVNKTKNYDNNNKIYNHNEYVFDNEQYKLIENKDKLNIQKNKLENNNINQNNSFCFSINNNYNYNLVLNNYNNQEIIKNKNNWKKKLNIINEQKKRMMNIGFSELNFDNKKDYNNINNTVENEEKKGKIFKIKKINSSFILNNSFKNKSSIIELLKPNQNLEKSFYMKKNPLNKNVNNNNSYNDYNMNNNNNNMEDNKNKKKVIIKNSDDLSNNDVDNLIEDKFTFKTKKNNINDNNNYNNDEEVCQLDIPSSNFYLYGNIDQKTAQFPDIINKENCYKFIPQNLTISNDLKNNNFINNTKSKEKKIYTKGRYDYFLLERNINNEFINNNVCNTQNNFTKTNNEFYPFNKDTENDKDFYEFNNSSRNNTGKKFVYSNKDKNKINSPPVPIVPKNLFKNKQKNKECIQNNIEEIKLNIKQKRKKINERGKNYSFESNPLNLENKINDNINEYNPNNSKIYLYNKGKKSNKNKNCFYLKKNNYQINKSKISIPQSKYFYQICNNKIINKTYNILNENNNNINKDNKNAYLNPNKKKFETLNNSLNDLYNNNKLQKSPFIIFKKKEENSIQNENNIINSNKNNDLDENFFKNEELLFNDYLTPKKINKELLTTNQKRINNINISIKGKKNTKLSKIKKFYNVSIKLPKSINSLITKKNIIINKFKEKNYKIKINKVCYFSKKIIIQPIKNLPIKNKCYDNDKSSKEKNNTIKIINNNEKKIKFSYGKLIKEKRKENKNEVKKEGQPFFHKINIITRKITDIFNKKNNRIINLDFNNSFNKNEDKDLIIYKNKCQTSRGKSHKIRYYFDSFSNNEINIINKEDYENTLKEKDKNKNKEEYTLKDDYNNKIKKKKIYKNKNLISRNFVNLLNENNNIILHQQNIIINYNENKAEKSNLNIGQKKRKRLGSKIEDIV